MDKEEARISKQYAHSKGKNAEEKKARETEKARTRVLDKYLGITSSEQKGRYADPASRVRG